jgi:transposase
MLVIGFPMVSGRMSRYRVRKQQADAQVAGKLSGGEGDRPMARSGGKGSRAPLTETERIARALAHAAYDARTIRLMPHDLAGMSHLVASRRGLFAVSEAGYVRIAHGSFFGLTLRGDSIFAFEACDLAGLPTRRGRIVRIDRANDRITGAHVLVDGLDNGCHQIDFIDGRLTVLDTQNQRVLRFGAGETGHETLYPLPRMATRAWSRGYAHVNSLLQVENRILLLLHNGFTYTGKASEVMLVDLDWNEIERRPLPGHDCHNLVVLEDGRLISCGSAAGEIIGFDGPIAKISTMMTRGLSVGSDVIAVGASKFSARADRHSTPGTVTFLDRAFQPLSTLELPAAPTEIRRLDGEDLGLSLFASARAPRD